MDYIWIKNFEWLLNHKDDLWIELNKDLNIYSWDYGYIYGIHNTILNKWYIGQTRSLWQRLWSGRGRNGYCQMIEESDPRSFIDCPKNFDFILLESYIKDDNILNTLLDREKFYVNKFDSFNNGYNGTKSGDLNEGSQTKGRKIYTNIITGDISYIKLSEIDSLDLSIYKSGRVNNIGKSWYHNPDNTKERYFYENEVPFGWTLGRLPGMGGNHKSN